MNKEKAHSYVLYGIESTKFSPKMCMAMVPFNLIMSAIAIALFHNIISDYLSMRREARDCTWPVITRCHVQSQL